MKFRVMNTRSTRIPSKRMKPILTAARVWAVSLLALPWASTWSQDLPFESGSTGTDGPLTFREIIIGGRSYHGAAYDAARNRLVVFGGNIGAVQGDTWLFDGVNWSRSFPATSPSQRYAHRMVWDAARAEVMMFGGHRGDVRLNDTWVWNGTTWAQKTPANSPSAREHYAMAYDGARQNVVLYGGTAGSGETWTWDGNDWTQQTPATSPPAHSNHALAYDAARQNVVLFGNQGQTWLWNGTDWARAFPASSPPAKNHLAMEYDPVRQLVILVSGSNHADTWAWNGNNWTQLSPANQPAGRHYHTLNWDAGLQRLVLVGGEVPGEGHTADTYLFDGSNWTFLSGKTQTFDMSSRVNGIWNFSTIRVPPGVTVRFVKNAGNTPVRWLATGNVTLDGVLDLNGEFGAGDLPPGIVPQGGPGGFAGGRGALRFDASGTFVGQPGQGPGGGDPGTAQQTSPENLRDGKDGQHNSAYGNAFLQPLSGGSGGGGGSSSNTGNGGNGGGGGGAILISSSRDIILNSVIRANGGSRQYSGSSQGGRGSGGGILLRADRVTGPGTLEAFGGEANNPNGRIRVEGYLRTLSGPSTPVAVVGLPSQNGNLNQVGTLTIATVDGANVVQPPTGNTQTPDVVFSEEGPVTVVVNGVGIPDGTPVALRITTSTSVIQATPVDMVGGTATFNVSSVPRGLGTLQATAQFTQN